jgi:hypothetical protein
VGAATTLRNGLGGGGGPVGQWVATSNMSWRWPTGGGW